MMFSKKTQGFSLLEMLTSVLIISLLVISSYLFAPKLINKAFDSRRKSDLDKIKNVLEMYYNFENRYPDELPDCGQPLSYGNQVLLTSFPCDPVTRQPYSYQTKKINTQSFRLYSMLANWDDPSVIKVGCQGGCGPDCLYNYGISSSNIGLISCSYVCAPGGGKTGTCEIYGDPITSLCPKLYYQDSSCNNECSDPKNRCENASGKNIPY